MPALAVTDFKTILLSELAILSDEIKRRLHASVDYRKLWDGRFDSNSFRTATNPMNGYRAGYTFGTYAVMLTMGTFSLTYETTPKGDLIGFTFSYCLPCVNDGWQPLYKNSIERATWDNKHFSTEKALRTAIRTKVRGLLEGIEKWYAASTLNPETFIRNHPNHKVPGGIDDSRLQAEMGVRSVMQNANRLRLCAEVMHERCHASGHVGNVDILLELATRFVEEYKKHLEVTPLLQNVKYTDSQ